MEFVWIHNIIRFATIGKLVLLGDKYIYMYFEQTSLAIISTLGNINEFSGWIWVEWTGVLWTEALRTRTFLVSVKLRSPAPLWTTCGDPGGHIKVMPNSSEIIHAGAHIKIHFFLREHPHTKLSHQNVETQSEIWTAGCPCLKIIKKVHIKRSEFSPYNVVSQRAT